MSDRIILVDSDMRVSPRNVRRTDTDTPLADAVVAWTLLNYADRSAVPSGSGSGNYRAGSVNDYDAIVPLSLLQTLTVDAFYILRMVVTQGGRQRTVERKVQAKRGYVS